MPKPKSSRARIAKVRAAKTVHARAAAARTSVKSAPVARRANGRHEQARAKIEARLEGVTGTTTFPEAVAVFPGLAEMARAASLPMPFLDAKSISTVLDAQSAMMQSLLSLSPLGLMWQSGQLMSDIMQSMVKAQASLFTQARAA